MPRLVHPPQGSRGGASEGSSGFDGSSTGTNVTAVGLRADLLGSGAPAEANGDSATLDYFNAPDVLSNGDESDSTDVDEAQVRRARAARFQQGRGMRTPLLMIHS